MNSIIKPQTNGNYAGRGSAPVSWKRPGRLLASRAGVKKSFQQTLARLSERVGVGEPQIAAVKVVAIGVGVTLVARIRHPIEAHIRYVVERDRKCMIFCPDVRRSDVKNRVVLVFINIGAALGVLILRIKLRRRLDVRIEVLIVVIQTRRKRVPRQIIRTLAGRSVPGTRSQIPG